MSNYLKSITSLILALSSFSLWASIEYQEKIHTVSTSSYWKKLTHFNEGYWSSESFADSQSFFLANDGKTNLESELVASIEAFKTIESIYTPQKIPAQCAFPERFKFIKSHFSELEFDSPPCPNFTRWKDAVIGESVSLVFASSFVNNPSSMFGHTFLKFNKRKNSSLSKDMFNYVVAFSAKADDKPGLFYAIKGLFGGYKGIVDVQPFYQTLREYSKVESRDIWEYELKLSQSQLDSLVSHIWELYANANFDYYFIDENCTSVLARILDLVTENEFYEEMSGYSLPTDFLRILEKNQLVEKTHYFPSLRKQFFASYDILSEEEKAEFDNILEERTEVGSSATLNSLVHYFDYIRHDHENEVSKDFQLKQKKILSLASKKGQAAELKINKPLSPEKGHLSGRLDLLYGNDNHSDMVVFNLRPSFHSLIDPAQGYEPWSHIELFSISSMYLIEDQKLVLDEVLIADIQSLPDFKLLDTNTSWGLDLKISPIYEESKNSSYKGSFNLNMGLSKHGELFLASILTGARVEGHDSFKNKVKVGPNIKINLGLNILRSKIILESSYFYSIFKERAFSKRDYIRTKLSINSVITKRLSLRINGLSVSKVGDIFKESYSSYSMGLGLYF